MKEEGEEEEEEEEEEGEVWKGIGIGIVKYSQVDITRLRLARDELVPRLRTLANDLSRILAILALAREGKLVLGLAIRDLVDAEPLIRGTQQARKVTLDILNVIQLGSERIIDVDDDNLPIGLALVQQRHHAQHFDLLDLAGFGDEFADLAHVERVVVALLLGFGVGDVGVFPRLREGAVVPEVALVWEAVAHEAQLALLGVLLDGVERLVFGDLLTHIPTVSLDHH
jgi:hypothetical protein